MTDISLTVLEFVAAATEEIYRRGNGDQGLSVTSGIKVNGANAVAIPANGVSPSGLEADPREEYFASGYFYSDRGFVGRIIRVGDPPNEKLYVIFRGSDSSESFANGFSKAIGSGSDQYASDPDRLSDVGDWVNNSNLGTGIREGTQLDDALALTRAAIELAGGDKSKIVVAGQSLGGGLSGLVSAIEGVKGYAFAPAPFANRIAIQAERDVLTDMGLSLTSAPPPIPTYDANGTITGYEDAPDFVGSGAGNKTAWLTANGYSQSIISAYSAALTAKIALYTQSANLNLIVHTLQGEILSGGAGQIAELLGANHFQVQNKTTYDIGLPSSYTSGIFENAAITAHGAAIHSLVIRTEDKRGQAGTKSFADLLKEDGALRYGLLENAKVSGLIEGDRIDPRDTGFGGSGVNSGGENAAILFRALWKEVDTGLYDRFAHQMGYVLSLGVAGEGKSATSANLDTIHGGLTLLGLQVVRDAIDRIGLESTFKTGAMNLFGDDWGRDGKQFATLDTRLINVTTASEPYGKSALNLSFFERLSISLGSQGLTESLMGSSREDIRDGVSTLSWKVIAVSTTDSSSFLNTYAPKAGLEDQSHLIIGGGASERIVGSSARDYISAGAGNDVIYASDLTDVIDGGLGSDTINFSRAGSGVSITLAEIGSYFAGGIGGAVISIENVTGSRYSDTVVGNGESNILLGGGGFDTLEGGGGHDVIDGGLGIDTVKLGHAFSTMNFSMSMTATQSLLTFSPISGSGWSQKITGVERFTDSNDITFTLEQVQGYYQNRATAPAISYLQSGGLETSQAGDVFGRVQIAQYLTLQPGESIVRYESSSTHLDSSWDGSALTFTLKASTNIDLENWNIGAGGYLNKLDAQVYAIVGKTVNGTYIESSRLVGPTSFQIIDVYDNGPTAIVVNDAFQPDPSAPWRGISGDRILAGSLANIAFSEEDPKHVPLGGSDSAFSPSRSDGIRIWADQYDRDDVVTMRLKENANGHFALIKSSDGIGRPTLNYDTAQNFMRPYWTIVMVKEGLNEFSPAQSVTIELDDGHTTFERTISIQIANINDAPEELKATAIGNAKALASPSLRHVYGQDINTRADAFVIKAGASGAPIIDLSTIDPDLHFDSHTYRFMGAGESTLDSTYGGLFEIVGSQIKMTRAPTPAELETEFRMNLVSTDSGGYKVHKTIQVYLDDETPEARTGTSGNDVLTGIPGEVAYVGLGGNDTVSYGGANGAIAVDLHNRVGLAGWAQGATFESIETIGGTRHADVYLAPQSSAGITSIGQQSLDYTLSFENWGVGVTYDIGQWQQTLNAGHSAFTFTVNALKTVIGSAHADTLKAGNPGKTLDGGAGDDTFHAKLQGDAIIGGDGTDTVLFSGVYGALTIDLSNGTVARSGWGPATTDAFSSIERFVGTSYADTIIGSAGADHMAGGAGDDTYLDVGADDLIAEAAWGGTDTVVTALATLTLQSEIENLTSSAAGAGALTGNASDNKITALAGAKAVYAMAGNDTIVIGSHAGYALDGGDGTDRLDASGQTGDLTANLGPSAIGGVAAGTLYGGLPDALSGAIATLASIEDYAGGSGRDHVIGSAGANTLSGGAGDDTLDGMTGDDVLLGGDGDDALHGGDGADTMLGGTGSNLIDGGLGTDTVAYEDRASGVTVALGLGAADGSAIRLEGGAAATDVLRSVENVVGTYFDDAITGNGEDNLIDGRGGNDVIDGGDGNDTIAFWNSNSTLTGGAGSDTFVHQYAFYQSPWEPYPMPSGTQTLITDFTSGEDKIRFAWQGLGMAWEYLGITNDGTDTTVDFYVGQIKLSGVHALTANDFLFA